MKLAKIIEQGMKKANAERGSQSLGDRSLYIGASDLGQCPRKACLGKVKKEDHDFSTVVRFERGHLTEDMLDRALRAMGFVCDRQTTLEGQTDNGTPLKFHLDFTIQSGDRFAVLETKSTAPVPSQPYDGWEIQLYAQMGLAQELYPEFKVEGTLFALNLVPKGNETPYGVWNGYTSSLEMWEALKQDADLIYQGVREFKTTGNLPELPLRPGPLCGFCSGLSDCPAYQGERVEALAAQVEELVKIQGQRKYFDQLESLKKQELRRVLRSKEGWVEVPMSAGEIRRLKVIEKSTRRVNYENLGVALEEGLGKTLEDFSTRSSHEELMLK